MILDYAHATPLEWFLTADCWAELCNDEPQLRKGRVAYHLSELHERRLIERRGRNGKLQHHYEYRGAGVR